MKQNKMAAVRKILSANPSVSPNEIVIALAKQRIRITTGVASNYKSVIRAGVKKAASKAQASKAQAPKKPAASKPHAAPSTNGSGSHGLETWCDRDSESRTVAGVEEGPSYRRSYAGKELIGRCPSPESVEQGACSRRLVVLPRRATERL